MSTIPVSLFLFLTAVSIDSLTAGLTYGTQRVKIRPFAYLILTFIPALFITLANRIGSCRKPYCPFCLSRCFCCWA